MSKKYTYNFVKDVFAKKGWKLISSEYKNNKDKLKCICPNGHVQYKRLNDFLSGYGCLRCVGHEKLTIIHIKKEFEKRGWTLLENTYVNNKTNMKCICPSGHVQYKSWNTFTKGAGCAICLHNTIIDKHIDYLKRYANVRKSISNGGKNKIELECSYCGKFFNPTTTAIYLRISVLEGKSSGESNFYCSEHCKKACPTYGQKLYPKGFKPATSREVQPQLRKLVLKRDNYKCQVCGTGDSELHCHHITGVEINPVESADVDNCVTLCKLCHKKAHKFPGCTYNELKCKK